MVSEMKSSRKRKCRENEDVGEMSLGEFMQKGLGSDSDEEAAPKKEKVLFGSTYGGFGVAS